MSTQLPRLPVCCSPEAFAMLSNQVKSIHSSEALLAGAIAVSMQQMKDVDSSVVDETLQSYADTILSRVRGPQPQALLAHLHELLFEEERFLGNTNDYYNPTNSYLPAVLKSKLGLPITLSLVYKSVAERLGFKTWGVGLPGHFLVGVQTSDDASILVDAFGGGRLMTSDEARMRVQEIFGPETEFSEQMLLPASHRHWLTRMLQNLLNIFGSSGQYTEVAAMLEMEIILWPEQTRLHRDLALVLARVGLSHPASQWLNSYLSNNPDDPQSDDLKQLLEVLTA